MTRVTGEPSGAGDAGSARSAGGVVPPAERGATRIADRVVAGIAAQAAREALGHLPPDVARPHTGVEVRHGTARVRVVLELDYPCDVGGRCAAVRRRVAERVEELAGRRVTEVAVRVERLHLVPPHGAAQGRTR
ncbi:hypothetical protein GCM10010358_36350 [Streptomyces minutiscleroticus]|uniref:Asp23/Gls24 family envelope stress response protein n=1 Tax=Streptomyces minutiscleroticus TaxID=68238 RepID=A0A918U137_9ACTN|nr:hypothetical protein GCM10010358_36350 [Streptomyces minutiscleroticus]